jgi:hypothetical protein
MGHTHKCLQVFIFTKITMFGDPVTISLENNNGEAIDSDAGSVT